MFCVDGLNIASTDIDTYRSFILAIFGEEGITMYSSQIDEMTTLIDEYEPPVKVEKVVTPPKAIRVNRETVVKTGNSANIKPKKGKATKKAVGRVPVGAQ